MPLFQSNVAKGSQLSPAPGRSGTPALTIVDFVVPAALAAGDIIEMGELFPLCRVVDMKIVSDDIDSNGAPTAAFDVGIMSGAFGSTDAARTCGNEFFAADTIGRTGGVSRMSKAAGFRVGKVDASRGIGLKLATGAATLVPGTVISLHIYQAS